MLENRTLTADDYERQAWHDLETDEALYRYLRAVRTFLWADGPYPDIDLDDYA